MKKLALFMIMFLALVMVVAAPTTTSRAATEGSIVSVCTFNTNVLYVTVSARGVTANTSGGDQIGVLANSHVLWGAIPADGQMHNFTFLVQLTGADPAGTATVQAGSGDGNQVATGYDFAGSGTFPLIPCSGQQLGVPNGFVLRTILCTTSVYATPGGQALDATVFIGQTWFVSPFYVVDRSGNHWTEIYDGGPIDGFIPTQCAFLNSGKGGPTANPAPNGLNSPIYQFTSPF